MRASDRGRNRRSGDPGEQPAGSWVRLLALDPEATRRSIVESFLIYWESLPGVREARVFLVEGDEGATYTLANGGVVRRPGEAPEDPAPAPRTTPAGTPSAPPAAPSVLAFRARPEGAIRGTVYVTRDADAPPGAASAWPGAESVDGFWIALENRARYAAVRREGRKDPLTGLANLRAAEESIAREVDRARRFERTFSLLLIDLDHFKQINDTWGHREGDRVLQKVAKLFEREVRSIDRAAKYGGDEFLLILPGTDRDGARILGERLLRALAAHRLPNDSPLTASIGIATFPADGNDRESLFESADRALYRVKREGGAAVAA